jgi:hypothetical protein
MTGLALHEGAVPAPASERATGPAFARPGSGGSVIVRPALAAAAISFLAAAVTTASPMRTDYQIEAQGAVDALHDLRVHDFLAQAPAYAGSLVLRAPFAVLPRLWGGGDLALYRSMALPGLLAAAIVGVFLFRRAIDLGCNRRAAWLALILVCGNLVGMPALKTGHPEELLGASLCLGAALAALGGRGTLSGVLLGLALANKPWAVIAVAPVLLLLDRGRWRTLAVCAGVAAVILVPLTLGRGAGIDAAVATAHSTGGIFKPWQLWWFLGDHAGPVHGSFGQLLPGYRTGPDWLIRWSHPIVVVTPVLLCLAYALTTRRRATLEHGLMLIAAAFFLRCLLDTWNTTYYVLPCVFALAAWELHVRRRAPVFALAVSVFTWFTIVIATPAVSADVEAVIYLVWALPMAALLGSMLFRPPPEALRYAARHTSAPPDRSVTSR